jgi:immunoglobulin-binding protein 1
MEQDGTVSADEADETKRQKDESWAVFTEENAKGAGNTMNR